MDHALFITYHMPTNTMNGRCNSTECGNAPFPEDAFPIEGDTIDDGAYDAWRERAYTDWETKHREQGAI